jgi:hypothetical protein
LDEDHLYLDLEAALTAVQKVGQATGSLIGVTPKTLAKRLHERGFLTSTEQAHGELRVRRTLEGRRRRVLHLTVSSITLEESGQSGQSDRHTQVGPYPGQISKTKGRISWTDFEDRNDESGQEIRPGRAEQSPNGRDRQVPQTGEEAADDALSQVTYLGEEAINGSVRWEAQS